MEDLKLYEVKYQFIFINNGTEKQIDTTMVVYAACAYDAGQIVKNYITSSRTRDVKILTVNETVV